MDNSLTAKLIQAIKQRPVLYLYSHPDFKKKTCISRAWKEVQKELNEDVEVMKNRWKNLKDTYRKCKNARLGKGIDRSNLANWIWAEQMSFLDTGTANPQSPHGTPTSPNETLTSPIIKQEQIFIDGSDNDLESPDTEDGQSEDILKSFDVTVFQNSNDKYLSLKRKKSGPIDRTNSDNNKPKRSNDDSGDIKVNCDRVDLFFLGLAHSFKELSHRTQINTKFELAKVLRDAELSDLKDNE